MRYLLDLSPVKRLRAKDYLSTPPLRVIQTQVYGGGVSSHSLSLYISIKVYISIKDYISIITYISTN